MFIHPKKNRVTLALTFLLCALQSLSVIASSQDEVTYGDSPFEYNNPQKSQSPLQRQTSSPHRQPSPTDSQLLQEICQKSSSQSSQENLVQKNDGALLRQDLDLLNATIENAKNFRTNLDKNCSCLACLVNDCVCVSSSRAAEIYPLIIKDIIEKSDKVLQGAGGTVKDKNKDDFLKENESVYFYRKTLDQGIIDAQAMKSFGQYFLAQRNIEKNSDLKRKFQSSEGEGSPFKKFRR